MQRTLPRRDGDRIDWATIERQQRREHRTFQAAERVVVALYGTRFDPHANVSAREGSLITDEVAGLTRRFRAKDDPKQQAEFRRRIEEMIRAWRASSEGVQDILDMNDYSDVPKSSPDYVARVAQLFGSSDRLGPTGHWRRRRRRKHRRV